MNEIKTNEIKTKSVIRQQLALFHMHQEVSSRDPDEQSDALTNIFNSVKPKLNKNGKPANSGKLLEDQFEKVLSDGLGFKVLGWPRWSKNLKINEIFELEMGWARSLNHKARFKANRNIFGNNILLKNVPYESLNNKTYNDRITRGELKLGELDEEGRVVKWRKSWTEFVLICNRFPEGMRIECKYQIAEGSTDQKLTGLPRNLEIMPEPNILVIYGGNGGRAGSFERLYSDIADLNEQYDNKHFEIVKTENLINWIINTLCK